MPDAPHRRLFLADDNDDLAALVTRRLERRGGWRVVRARTSAEAEARLRGDRFDAVVLDYRLPDGDGLHLLGVLRANAPETPVLFLTAHGSEDVAMRAMSLGATDYMQKSGEMFEDLPQRLDELVARAGDIRQAARVTARDGSAVRVDHGRRGLERILGELVRDDVMGAAVYDDAGKPLAALLPAGLDARMLGHAARLIHQSATSMAGLPGLDATGYVFSLETTLGLVASTTVGERLLLVVVDPVEGTSGATTCLDELSRALRT